MSQPRRYDDVISKAFGRDPASRAAMMEICMKLVRINKDLNWWIDEYSTVDILSVQIRPTLPEHLRSVGGL
jgi:hypothetical protein